MQVEKISKKQVSEILKGVINTALLAIHHPVEQDRFNLSDENVLLEEIPDATFANVGLHEKELKDVSSALATKLGIEVGEISSDTNLQEFISDIMEQKTFSRKKVSEVLKGAINTALLSIHHPVEQDRFNLSDENVLLEEIPDATFANVGLHEKELKDVSSALATKLGIEVGEISSDTNLLAFVSKVSQKLLN